MSRHRSPGGLTPRHRATPAVHRGMAAAAAGGALAAAVPVGALVAVPTSGAAALSLSSAAAADGARRVVSVVLVPGVPTPEPPGFSVAGLVKSAGLAEAARETAADCDADTGGLGRVKPWVREAARFLSCRYGHPDLIGVAGRARHSDHPAGLAVDFLVRGERGDRLAACALANRVALGVSYVIWRQRINFGDGWQRMEDRGSATENHLDHVHVSFEPTGAGRTSQPAARRRSASAGCEDAAGAARS